MSTGATWPHGRARKDWWRAGSSLWGVEGVGVAIPWEENRNTFDMELWHHPLQDSTLQRGLHTYGLNHQASSISTPNQIEPTHCQGLFSEQSEYLKSRYQFHLS